METKKTQVIFGPYGDAATAKHYLSLFLSQALPLQLATQLGIVWSDDNECQLLKAPLFDKNGNGFAVSFVWTGPVPPRKHKAVKATQSKSSALRSFFSDMRQRGDQLLVEGENVGIGVYNDALVPTQNWMMNHPKTMDTINTGLDLVGVATSGVATLVLGSITAGGVATTATGVGAVPGAVVTVAASEGTEVSWTGVVANGALAVADARHLYLEWFGTDEQVKTWEHTAYYKYAERAGPVVALFDPARNFIKMIGKAKQIAPLTDEMAKVSRDAADAQASAAQATVNAQAQSARLNKLQNFIDQPGHVGTNVDQKILASAQSANQATQKAQEAAVARAAGAANKLAKLQKEADALKKELEEYRAKRLSLTEATRMQDAMASTWAGIVYGTTNPWGKEIGTAWTPSKPEPLPNSHYISIGVIAVGPSGK